ncbi:MAG: TatD family hydrolase [Butyrivibrio sp.]|nr:TatD family hydrolase [Butyrivibrio sp.]
MNGIFESHAHYEDRAFDEDREALIASLPSNGIEYVVNVGTTAESCRRTVELISQYGFIYGALGIHPSEIRGVSGEDLDWLEKETAANPKVVAVGEIGLDYHWDKDNKAQQKSFFARQIELARRLGKPIIVHSREAAFDTWDVMRSERASDCGGVVHCFSYGKEEAAKYLDMGFYIGIGGASTFKNAVKPREVIAYVPLERILLETDCPYLAPVPFRGKRNSSLYLPIIAENIAAVKGIDAKTVCEVTRENAKRMYGII